MKIITLADTHNLHNNIKTDILDNLDADCIIHAGDSADSKYRVTNQREQEEFIKWFASLPIKHKIYVPGNHNVSEERFSDEDYSSNGIIRLIDQQITIDDVVFYGSPYTPSFGENWAYNKSRGNLHKVWEKIPSYTDVLITHGPPYGILDATTDSGGRSLVAAGCKALLKKVFEVKPTLHVFGHIHNNKHYNNNGILIREGITFVNASIVADVYVSLFDPSLINTNSPIIINI